MRSLTRSPPDLLWSHLHKGSRVQGWGKGQDQMSWGGGRRVAAEKNESTTPPPSLTPELMSLTWRRDTGLGEMVPYLHSSLTSACPPDTQDKPYPPHSFPPQQNKSWFMWIVQSFLPSHLPSHIPTSPQALLTGL